MTGREGDNSRESLLYFEGHLEVQGLFEYLFNERRKLCGEECDVPLLMAPVPFPAACLKQLHLKVLKSASHLFLLWLLVVAAVHSLIILRSYPERLHLLDSMGVEAVILVACMSDAVLRNHEIGQQTWRDAADCTQLAWA